MKAVKIDITLAIQESLKLNLWLKVGRPYKHKLSFKQALIIG